MVNLIALQQILEAVQTETRTLGMSVAAQDRILHAIQILPTIEAAREKSKP